MGRIKEKIVGDLDNIYVVGKDRYGLSGGSCFLINSEKNVLIESGTSFAVDKIFKDLSRIGIRSLDYIMLTHIHLDHAGGASFLLERYPDAEVVVHGSGTEHLVDPTRLKKSVKKAAGEAFESFGDIKPIQEEKMVPVNGGEKFDLGKGHSIEVKYSPGHAPHHNCYFERKTKSLAVGDIAGRYSPEKDLFFPTTPPPGFDFEETVESLTDLKDLDLDYLLYSHKGWADKPYEKLNRYTVKLKEWVNKIKKAFADGKDREKIIRDITKYYGPILSELVEENGEKIQHIIRMNTEGVLLYLEKQQDQK